MTYDVGIDVGTTFTAAAVSRGGAVEAVALTTTSVTVPSVVYASGDEMLFGGAADRRGATEPDGLAREFKRRVGDPVPLMLSGSPFHADRLTALMARWVLSTVGEQLGGPPRGVVFTHPANWTEYQLGTLRNALADVDLGHAELISEPAAAALDYAAVAHVEDDSALLVYDLGGGTFDVALLRRAGDRFEHVVDPAGIERLGGIDFDEAVFQFALARLGPAVLDQARQQPEGAAGLIQLKRRCVEAKEALSSDVAADIPVMLPGHTSTIRITRAEFESMIRPSIDQTITLVQRTIERAGVEPSHLHATLLVGGSSRIPLVSQLVADELQVPVRVDAHPKLVTARGAARLAGSGVGRPGTGSTTTAPRHGRAGSSGRTKLLIGGGVLVAAAAIAGGVLALSSSSDDDDPTTGSATSSVVAPTDPTTPGDVTTVAGSTPSDPTTTDPPATVPPFRPYAVATNIATLPGPIDLELVGDDLWVMSQEAGTLQRFDAASPTPTALDTVPLEFSGGKNGNDVVAVGDKLYVTQQDAGTVARVNLASPADGPVRIAMPTVPGTDEAGRPLNAAELDGTLWVTVQTPSGATDRGYLVPIDTATDTVGDPIPMSEVPYGIVAADGDLWVTLDDVDQIGRVDVDSGAVETITGFDQPLDILPVEDDLWVVNAESDELSVVDPAVMQIRRNVPVGFRPWKIAAGMGSIWVANSGNGEAPGSLSRIDATTNDARAQQDPVELQVAPIELAVGDERVFVVNFGSATVSVLEPQTD